MQINIRSQYNINFNEASNAMHLLLAFFILTFVRVFVVNSAVSLPHEGRNN